MIEFNLNIYFHQPKNKIKYIDAKKYSNLVMTGHDLYMNGKAFVF